MTIQPLAQTTPAISSPPRLRRTPMQEGSAHFQLTAVSNGNRSYGASREVPHTNDLAAFLQGLAENGFGQSIASLAGTGVEYMVFEYGVHENGADVIVQGDNPPTWAVPYYSDGAVRIAYTGDTSFLR